MLLKMLLVCLLFSSILFPQSEKLKIMTINAWSGLDYNGYIKVGEYETAEKREERFCHLAGLITKNDPDIVFVQEANPVSSFASRLSSLIHYDEIHQVCNAGVKFGPVGFPLNLKEGIIILVKPELNLKRADTWKLSGSFGIYGDLVSIHFDQSIFSLVGKITLKDAPVYLINVHTAYCPSNDSLMMIKYNSVADKKGYSADEKDKMYMQVNKSVKRRNTELEILKEKLAELSEEYPVIIAGDFNAGPNDEAIKSFIQDCRLKDTFLPDSSKPGFTWDPVRNGNTSYSTSLLDIDRKEIKGYDLFSAMYDSIPRRIDYIFLNEKFQKEDVIDYNVLSDKWDAGISDHFAVTALVDLKNSIRTAPKEFQQFRPFSEGSVEPLPVVSYDNDAGLGYGVKAFFLNQFGLNESFDLTLFNSTNGERWYRVVLSSPDLEHRQGKIYPFAFDLTLDYDKWIKNSFFGIGSNSTGSEKEYYTKEPLEISITASRGFTTEIVGQAGIKYKSISSSNFSGSGRLIQMPLELNAPEIRYYSIFTNFRYDTRNSFINPDEGIVLQGEVEFSLNQSSKINNFSRLSGTFQHYLTLFYPKTVLSTRLIIQSLMGDNLPLQMLLPLGGNSTLRGFPQDRFLDRTVYLLNSELRFPIFWRFGGIVGVDLGRVSPSINKFSLKNWAVSPAAGLRFYMDNFIIRLDMGFSNESTGLYFNFNHIF